MDNLLNPQEVLQLLHLEAEQAPKLYTIRPLEWVKQKQTWTAQGINHEYVVRPEHQCVRLRCVNKDGNTVHMSDFAHHQEAIVFATKHNERMALKFLKVYEPAMVQDDNQGAIV